MTSTGVTHPRPVGHRHLERKTDRIRLTETEERHRQRPGGRWGIWWPSIPYPPDRVVVGEVRGAEVVDLLTALNTGHDGGAGTVHANSPREVPARLEALAALGGMAAPALHSQLAAAVQVVLHVHRGPDGARGLAAVGVLVRSASGVVTVLPAWSRSGGSEQGWATLVELLADRGVTV